MDEFRDLVRALKLNQEEINISNRPITKEDIEI